MKAARPFTAAAILVSFLALCSACTSNGPEPAKGPGRGASEAATIPPSSPTAYPSTSVTGPTASASASEASVYSGRARLQVSGAFAGVIRLGIGSPSVYSPPPAGFALTYRDGSGDVFSVGGVATIGTRRTSSSLVVSLLLGRGGLFVSASGECTVRITTANREGVAGLVRCRGLANRRGTIGMAGVFRAEP